MKSMITSMLVPPVGACRYGCGTNCTPAITVFWLFGVVSVFFGLMGGPINDPGINWYTVGLGLVMWGIAAVWTLLTLQGVESNQCGEGQGAHGQQQDPADLADDPLDEVRKSL